MAFEIRNADTTTIPFIIDCLLTRSNNPARVFAEASVPKDERIAYYKKVWQESIEYANESGKEVVIRAVDKKSGRDAAVAQWILPQDTDDPSPLGTVPLPKGVNEEVVQQMRTKYRQSRKELLNGRRCFVLHNIVTHADFAGQGAGGLLLRWAFEEADRLEVPCILSTYRDGPAVSFYVKHGFSIAGSYDLEFGGQTTTNIQMIREPNSRGTLKAAILIVSDTASQDPATDKSGPALQDVFKQDGGSQWEVGTTEIVPDSFELLQSKIISWTGGKAGAEASPYNLIVTSGGTGFATKDTTPEAIEPLLERKAPGLVHLMLSSSLQVTPFAAMARPVAGTRGKTVIVALPGSPKGAKENLQAVLKLLPHACQQAAGANSRSLHSGGVKKLEADAGISVLQKGNAKAGDGVQDHHHHHHHGHGHGGHHHGPAGPHTRPEDRPVPNDPSAGPSARYRESPYPMLTVADALSRILSVSPAPSIEERAVNPDLVGYILAEDVTAPNPVPAFRASIVDGYACVVGENGKNEKGSFPVVSVSHAAPGQIPKLEAGSLARITTGAPLPPNASAVIMVEDTVLKKMSEDGKEEAEVEILTDEVKDGENVREIGSDIPAGETVLRKGAKVSAVGGELGILASIGKAKVKVYVKPVVGVMSTGDEIVPHDREGELRHGEVRDTNRITLMSAIQGWGYEAVDLGIARDASGSLESTLREAMRRTKIIVTTGGVSMGELDLLKPTIERSLGGTIHFGRVAMKPGKPTTFATVPFKDVSGDPTAALVFSLPGNPASGMVTAGLFLRPCLDKISGVDAKILGMPRVKVVLAGNARRDPKREEYQRAAIWQEGDGKLYGQVTGMQRSSRIGSFASANCLLVISPGEGALGKGDIVDGLLLSGLGHAV